MAAIAVLSDGRIVTGGHSFRGVGAGCWWDPAQADTDPIELGRGEDGVAAIAVLGDGRIVTGGPAPAVSGAGCWCGTRPSPAPIR